MTDQEISEQIARYHFYHCIRLSDQIVTPGNPVHQPSQVPVQAALERLPLKGKRVLDVGCRDGMYSFQAERQGAAEVIGIDNCLSPAAVEFLIPFFQSKLQMHALNLYDLTPARFGQFDVILFAGVLYHLRYPVWALKLLKECLVPGGLLLIETAIYLGDEHRAMQYCPIGGEGPYGFSSCCFFNQKGLTDTLLSLGFRVHWASRLHPDARPKADSMTIDRLVLLGEYTGLCCNQEIDRYWNGFHSIHLRPQWKLEWQPTPSLPLPRPGA